MTSYLLFSSPACVPCQRMKPLIAQESITADVTVTDIVTPDDLFEVLEVTGVPTLLAMKDGREVGRLTGLKSQADLIVFFEETS
ncbi:thioredoxin family protein [Streptomyces sp. H27-G5]|uniref:thioredoxin family protein n=1 Tax=Streptomyces sp. H27-G5 TaxID=2996698 RepID=UPI002271BFF7|nr:thioredoxin family protein [Streptomyces sp. H27-G5]MCY0923645.1 thioredoxin family protein [Streptomyces sp. H27-G5]